MKRIITFFLSLIVSVPVGRATDALFFNAGTITNAIPIDATTFLNLGTFTNIFTSELPYDMSNVRFFTNRGTMSGSVGFKFDNVDTALGTRRPLVNFYNGNGANISGIDADLSTSSFFTLNNLFNGFGAASFVKISATNLVNRGNLSVGTIGLMQVSGKNVDLSRGSLSAGQLFGIETNTFFNNGFFGFNQNTFGVEDLYGGAGPQTLNISGQFIGGNSLGYFPPNGVFSPFHNVQFRAGSQGGAFGGINLNAQVSLPLTFPADFEAHAYVEDIRQTSQGTDKIIQVVFVKTNFVDTNITSQVRFGFTGSTFGGFGRTAIVEFSTPELDPVSGEIVTNAIYLLDNAAEFGAIFAFTNIFSSAIRPSTYQITTVTPFEWAFADPSNTVYDPSLIFPGNSYPPNGVVDGFYAGYGAQVGRNPELASGVTGLSGLTNFNFFGFGFTNLESLLVLPDPTNQPGRIEINADNLDMTLTRIRAEGALNLNAKHLHGGGAFDVSAGIVNADLGSTNGSLVISNIFPSHFKRVRGNLYAYTTIWNNTETNAVETNNNRFHVLILDHELKADFTPTIRNLTLRSTNLLIKDNLTITRSAKFHAENLTFTGTNTFSERAISLRAGNFVGVKNFLNESNSVFQGANDAYFGFDTVAGWESITNRGTITATAPLFKATSFSNSGTIVADDGGSIIIQAGAAELSNSTNTADGNVFISAGDLRVTGSTITAGAINDLGQLGFGQLILNITNLLTDFGDGASNVWQVSNGFELQRKPFEGDLLGTEIRTIVTGFTEAEHRWAGEDVGPNPEGFVNNVALGHLILDVRSPNASLRFTGTGFENALYVVDLDFNVSTNVDINTSLNNLMTIDDNMRIYYVNSNAGDKLTNAFPGRVIQVEDFGFDDGLAPLSLTANGLGIVTPNLDGKKLKVGDNYQLKAKPGRGQIFKEWSGGTNSSSATLTFKMRRHLALNANFIPNPFDDPANPVVGNYNGLFSNPVTGVQHESSGFINLKLTKSGSFSGKILSAQTVSFRGVFNASGHAQLSVRRPHKSDLTLDLQLDLASQSDQITGTISDGNWTANLVVDRAEAVSVPVVEAGKHTMVIPGGETPGPLGDGFGTVNVNAKGSLQLKGTLADGTRIQQKVNISKDGRWPFYAVLYRGSGSLLSWITFTNGSLFSFNGDATWFKKPVADRIYQNGFTNVTSVIGSRYAAAAPVLGINTGTVTLSGGNLSNSLTNEFTLSSNNVVTTIGTNGLSIKIALPTGLFNGKFIHPDTKKTATIKGVVLQQQNNARGFFLGTNQSGAVILEGN